VGGNAHTFFSVKMDIIQNQNDTQLFYLLEVVQMNELKLQEVTKKYLKENGLSVRFMAQKTDINRTSLQLWINGSRNLNIQNIVKIKQFLSGSYIQSAETITAQMVAQSQEGA